MRASTLLLPVIATLPLSLLAQSAAPSSPASYESIELRGGGVVTVRYGPERRVTVRQANPDRPIRPEGERLVIDRCAHPCPRGHRIHVEVVTPEIVRLAVSDGGLLQVADGFPSQPSVAVAVNSGGMIDTRSLDAASVSAAVSQGGRILTRPGREMTASVLDGGSVTYWGDASVRSSVRRGGVVARGAAADLSAPIAGFDPPPPTLSRPVPPRPPRPARTH